MGKFYTILLLLFTSIAFAQKHEVSLQSLLNYTTLNSDGFAQQVKHKGFKPFISEGDHINQFEKVLKDKTTRYLLERQERKDTMVLLFQTTSQPDFLKLKEELHAQGFVFPKNHSTETFPLYQKRNYTALLKRTYKEEKPYYQLELAYKPLPAATEIHYAEDLLQLNTHEYLAAVFGAQNVKHDIFYFSEKEINKCSILFPNTSSQVTFIWEDEINEQGISFLILGGQMRSSNTTSIYNGNEFHKWRSKQGVYLGMSLKELQALNGSTIEFYGWETEQAGFVRNQNKGKLDLSRLGLQLHCLDCYKEAAYSKPILSSQQVLQTDERVIVSSIIIPADKNKSQR